MKQPGDKLRQTVEFAAALYKISTNSVEATFQRFVKPQGDSQLTAKELTQFGIKQEQIDVAQDFAGLIRDFEGFIKSAVKP